MKMIICVLALLYLSTIPVGNPVGDYHTFDAWPALITIVAACVLLDYLSDKFVYWMDTIK